VSPVAVQPGASEACGEDDIDAIVESALAESHSVSVTPIRQSSVKKLGVAGEGMLGNEHPTPEPLRFTPAFDSVLPSTQSSTALLTASGAELAVDINWKAQKVIRNHMF
jgi:hypothetical protein